MAAVDSGLADFLALNTAENDLEREKLRNEELKAKIADLEGKLAASIAEVEKKELDCKVHELAYGKVLDRLVEKQIDLDYLKRLAQAPNPTPVVEPVEEAPEPENPEPVVVVEETELVNINTCSEREIMNLGFTFSVARNITAARPFLKMDDLRIVPGMTRIAFGLIEKKVTLGDISEYQKPKKPVKLDPLETVEPVEDKVNVNTASAVELSEKLGIDIIACYSITGPRKRDGLYKSIEEVKNCKKLGPRQWEKIKDRICV
jgi:DNA uptake protein ComE-like DNA-binding protein